MTDAAFEQKVRERAYEIWAATGCEDGLADLHWLSAEQALMSEAAQPCAKAAPKAAAKAAVSKSFAPKGGKARASTAAPARTLAVKTRAKGKAAAHA